MSMHLVGPYMTTNNTKKRKSKKKSRRQMEAEAHHEKFLKRMGVNKKKTDFRYDIPSYKSETTNNIPTSDAIGNGTRRKNNTYTGDYIIGIGTMHKSNAVPITNKKSAKDLANMRR